MGILSESNAISLTEVDFQELVEEAQQQGELIYQLTEFGVKENFPQQLGSGEDQWINLRDGLTIHLSNVRLWQPLCIERQHEVGFPLTSKFYLSGSSRVQTQKIAGVRADYEEVAGYNYLYCLPDLSEVETWQSDQLIQVVMVYAHADYFRSFSLSSGSLPSPLQKVLQGDSTERFHQSLGVTTPVMNQVLRQILNCPYHGPFQQFYLESKALELFMLQFMKWAEDQPQITQPVKLQPCDIERLHEAKKILVSNLNNPPSLLEIARQVGLNDCKLKQGFRQVFGTTLFGYLYDYRMQQAQQLLLNSNLSIAGIAAVVGYRNPEAFSTAFRRRFGISPKAYQVNKCC